jgi:hypothetical protein
VIPYRDGFWFLRNKSVDVRRVSSEAGRFHKPGRGADMTCVDCVLNSQASDSECLRMLPEHRTYDSSSEGFGLF